MRGPLYYGLLALVPTALAAAIVWHALLGGGRVGADCASAGRLPCIRPDYVECVIPPNIASLNFRIQEPGVRYVARIYGTRGRTIEVASGTGRVVMPLRAWSALLHENRGAELYFDIYVKARKGRWSRYATVTNKVAAENIDGYLAYRLIDGVYNIWGDMGIYQRTLESYDESLVLANTSFGNGCVNCHTFWNNRPDKMVIQIRHGPEDYGSGMVLIDHGVVKKVDTRTPVSPTFSAYVSWHPSGRLAAFSMNKVRQFFHTARGEVRDVCDLDSDLAVYVADSGSVISTPAISRSDRLETYPTWSPDGRYLYYCSAPILWSDRDKLPPEHYDQVRYDLMRISCDTETRTWGEPETVLSGQETGKSITLPRISPDGRWLLFCMSDYGCFPIHQASADLYMMDLTTRQYKRLGINSDRTESWHSWSSNGRWIVFSSKRLDGLLARPYFSYVDAEGETHKPFLLPQRDPDFYDGFLRTYNLPELIGEPIRVRGEGIAGVIRSGKWVKVEAAVTSASPRSDMKASTASPGEAEEPWQPRH